MSILSITENDSDVVHIWLSWKIIMNISTKSTEPFGITG